MKIKSHLWVLGLLGAMQMTYSAQFMLAPNFSIPAPDLQQRKALNYSNTINNAFIVKFYNDRNRNFKTIDFKLPLNKVTLMDIPRGTKYTRVFVQPKMKFFKHNITSADGTAYQATKYNLRLAGACEAYFSENGESAHLPTDAAALGAGEMVSFRFTGTVNDNQTFTLSGCALDQ